MSLAPATVLSQLEFERFVTDRRSAALGYARYLTRDPHEAEDVVQDALGRLWRRWSVEPLSNPWGYLLATIRNTVIDRHRRSASEHTKMARIMGSVAAQVDQPALDDHDELASALALLPDAQRRTVVLRYLLDMSEAETARQLGVSAGAAKSNASRGISKLRDVYRARYAA